MTAGRQGAQSQVFTRRTLTLFGAASVVVLLAGVAFAQAGSLAPRAPEPLLSFDATTPEKVASASRSSVGAPEVGEPRAVEAPAEAEVPFAIEFPSDDQRFDDKVVTFRGTAPIGWTVTGAGYAAERDGAGGWSLTLILSPGANRAVLYAVSPDGSATRESRVTAHYDVARASNDSDEPPSIAPEDGSAFTANHKYGEGWGKNPYDMYWGTGTPGDMVHVISLYGAAETTVGSRGAWDVRVPFRDAPVGAPFDVVVESGDGGQYTFQFVFLGDPRDGGSNGQATEVRPRDPPAAGDRGHAGDDRRGPPHQPPRRRGR